MKGSWIMRTLSLVLLLTLLLPVGLTPGASAHRGGPSAPAHEGQQGGTNPYSLGFAGGSGTWEDPYLVATAEHLDSVRNYLDAHFLQTADIDLGVAPWSEGEGWIPIAGEDGEPFAGTFDGGGHTIRNLTIDRSWRDSQGLFEFTSGAVLLNIRLVNVHVSAYDKAGGLLGSAHRTQIENTYVTGHVVGGDKFGHGGSTIGGLAGWVWSPPDLSEGHVQDTFALVEVEGRHNVGGLVGRNDSIIHRSYALGGVEGTYSVGGLVGTSGASSLISDSFSRASVVGIGRVGGLVGWNSDYNSVVRSYSAGPVTGTGDDVGGLIGRNDGEDNVSDCYWDTDVSGHTESAGGDARNTDQMTHPYAANTYVDWDFVTTWAEDADYARNEGYPYLLGGPEAPGVRVRILGQRGIFPGEIVDYAVRYTNSLEEKLEDPVLILRLPHLATYKESSAGGIYWPQRDLVFWRLTDLEPQDRGTVSLHVEYEWGIPQSVGVDMAALMVAGNYNVGAVDLPSYLDYVPLEVTATEGLSNDEWDDEAAAIADLDTLYSEAVDAGYLWGAAERVSLSDGTTALQAVLIEPEQQSVRMLIASDEGTLAATFNHNFFTLEDTSGGIEWELEIDEHSFWGEWADIAGPAASLSGSTLHAGGTSGGLGCCLENCLTTAALKAIVGNLSRILQSALTFVDCAVALATLDPGALAGCAASIQQKLPFLSETVDVINCLTQCRDDPNSHACEADKVLCRSHYPIDPYRPFESAFATQWTYHCEDGCYSRRPTPKPCAMDECCVPGRGCVHKSVAALGNPAEICSMPLAGGPGGSDCKREECNPPADPNEKHGPDGDLLPGQWVDYSIEYENVGSGEAYGVYILDYLDEAFDDTTLQVGPNATYYPASRLISWDIGTLAPEGQPGSRGEVTMSVRLNDDLPGGTVVTNQATVYFPTVPEETPTGVVLNVIQPVVAEPQSLTTPAETPLEVTLSGRDVSEAPLTYRVVEGPFFGTLSGEPPNLTYKPMEGHLGPDRFSFVVNNDVMDSRPAQIYIRTLTSTYLPLVLRQL